MMESMRGWVIGLLALSIFWAGFLYLGLSIAIYAARHKDAFALLVSGGLMLAGLFVARLLWMYFAGRPG
jgi:hypothetical protein